EAGTVCDGARVSSSVGWNPRCLAPLRTGQSALGGDGLGFRCRGVLDRRVFRRSAELGGRLVFGAELAAGAAATRLLFAGLDALRLAAASLAFERRLGQL